MTKQIETATIVGTITGSGNAKITVTSTRMSNSPKIFLVSVTMGDTASQVASAVRTALAFDADVAATFLVSGTGADVKLTEHVSAANDATLNIASTNDTCTGLTPQPTSANTQAGDGILNGYCTLADLKSSDVLNTPSSVNNDDFLAAIINSVSRSIDTTTSRHFYKSSTSETWYFTAREHDTLSMPDFVSISELKTDDCGGSRTYPYTWSLSDYDLYPYNAAYETEPMPYTAIERSTAGIYDFPIDLKKGVKVTGIFGFPQIPAAISKACLLWSERIFKRFQTPLGISSTSALGQTVVRVPPPDPDVLSLLANYMRRLV